MITSPNGVEVKISPWLSNGFKLVSIRLYEELGGNIASGTASFEIFYTEDAQTLIYKQYTGTIEVTKLGNNGNKLSIDFFITKRKLVKNRLTIEFLCVNDNKFFTELISLEHTDITETLKTLYPNPEKINIRASSDIGNDIPLIQFNETNYSFCKKLAYSFKKDTIFAFGWEGFMLKDRCGEKNSADVTEIVTDSIDGSTGVFIVVGGSGVEPMDPYTMNYDNLLFEKVVDPWAEDENEKYKEIMPLNSNTLKYYNNYITIGTSHASLVKNYLYNDYMMTNNMQVSLRIESSVMPNYKLGDIVIYCHVKDQTTPYRAYIVKTNELYYSPDNTNDTGKSEFFWVSTLVSLFDPNGNKYPWETDPTLELENGKLK